jgi:dephospho-CoA kinase
MRVVITGNIGTGKSTVCNHLLSKLVGFRLVSADDLVRELYISHEGFRAYLQATFGTLSRREVAARVFADAEARQALVEQSLQCLTSVVDALFQQENVLIEFPLFFENPRWVAQADYVIALHCPAAIQQERVMARDNLSAAEVERIINAQMPMAAKVALAHAAIDTGTSMAETFETVETLATFIEREALRRRCDAFFGAPEIWPYLQAAYAESHRGYHTLHHLAELFATLAPYQGIKEWAAVEMAEIWPYLQAAYAESHRGYHTLHHLAELFATLAPYQGIKEWAAVEMAVWFHDVIYSTHLERYADNEALSAQALVRMTRAHCSAEWQASFETARILAVQLILASKDHKVTPYLENYQDALEAAELFLDADRAILGADADRLAEYDAGIAFEWLSTGRLDPSVFRNGRRDALLGLAAHKPLFYSKAFAHLTDQAQANLARLAATYAQLATA